MQRDPSEFPSRRCLNLAIQKTPVAPVFESLEAESAKSASHTVLENYPDWWVRRAVAAAKRASDGCYHPIGVV